jgi:hypothetical protein
MGSAGVKEGRKEGTILCGGFIAATLSYSTRTSQRSTWSITSDVHAVLKYFLVYIRVHFLVASMVLGIKFALQ